MVRSRALLMASALILGSIGWASSADAQRGAFFDSGYPSPRAVPRYDDDLADAGAIVTVIASLGMAASIAGTYYAAYEDTGRLGVPVITGSIALAVGGIGVPLWVAGTAPDESKLRGHGETERRSTAMGVTGIVMTTAGVVGTATTIAVAADIGGQGDFGGIGAAFVEATAGSLAATLLGAGIALTVKGFQTVGGEEERYLPVISAGPTNLSAAWAF